MPKNKTDNFLKAIKRYAGAQKRALAGEVKQLKTERLKEAEAKAKQDSERMKREKLAEARSRQAAAIASQTQTGQKELFVARSEMTEEVFRLAAEKLAAYTKTGAYRQKLAESAREIAKLFAGKDCVIYVNERDLDAAQEFKALFGENSEVKADKAILLGGVKAYCESMGIIADETLDSKLSAQREWFVENAALSVL